MHRLPNHLRTLTAALALVATMAMVTACGTEQVVAGLAPALVDTTPAPEPTEAPAPPPTEAPAPTPTVAPVDPEANPIAVDSDDWFDLLIAVLIGAAIILAAALVIAALVSRSRKQPARAQQRPPATPTLPPSPQASLLSTSQWINDQLALELMAAPPAAALSRWSVERSRLDNVVIGAHQQHLQMGVEGWQLLAQSVSTLSTALDTNLQLRGQSPPDAQLIIDSTDVVNRQRNEVRALIAALAPTVPR